MTGKGEFRIPVVIEIEPDRIQQTDTAGRRPSGVNSSTLIEQGCGRSWGCRAWSPVNSSCSLASTRIPRPSCRRRERPAGTTDDP